jgi:hypothetical protein
MTPTFIQVEREQAKGWLRVLNHCRENLFLKDYVEHIDDASRAIKQALAAPVQEPVYKVTVVDDENPNGVPLSQWGNRPTPPAAQWVGLEREIATAVLNHCYGHIVISADMIDRTMEVIEAKLKEQT